MLAAHDNRPDEDTASAHAPAREAGYGPIERHGYEAPRSSRVFGGIGTIAACSLIAAGFLVTLDHFDRPAARSAPPTVMLLPIAATPLPEPRKADKPRPVRKAQPVRKPVRRPDPPGADPVPRPLVPLPSPPVAAAGPQKVSADPTPPATKAAPSTPPAPSRHEPDNWEGRVIARLEKYRRYPGDAQHARQQGTVYIRFRINREGHVLASSLERSSGYPALDAAALETLRRADPLPKVPPDRPDEIELQVPMEFFLQR